MAATDPTRSIRRHEHPSPFDLGAEELLTRISALQPSVDVPYLTVTLDWRISGDRPGRRDELELRQSQRGNVDASGGSGRPARRQIEVELGRLIDEYGPRGEGYESLAADRDRIIEWLRSDLDPAAQGAYIVANTHHGVFEATGLAMPLETSVTLAPTPTLYSLVRLIEDNPVYAVLVVDQGEAELSFITHGAREHSVTLESNLYPRRVRGDDWNERRLQNRAKERIEAFARDVIAETMKALRETGVNILVLAGSTVMMSAIEREAGEGLLSLVIDRIRTETPITAHDKIELTLPVAERAERDREAMAVRQLADRTGAGTRAVTGAAGSLRALKNGQVSQLMMLDSFEERGWGDYTMPMFGVGAVPGTHPVGGDVTNIRSIELRDEMVRLSLAIGAGVEIIHSQVAADAVEGIPKAGSAMPRTEAAEILSGKGGVGALLRYTIDV